MEGRRRHLSSRLSARVADRVRQLRDEKGMSTSELISATGFKQNYYYMRMRLDVDFSLSDLEILARTLDVSPHELLGESAERPGLLRLNGAELADRLGRLMRTYGQDADVDHLVASVRETYPEFSETNWTALVGETGTVSVDSEIIEAIADYFGVDDAYLAEPLVDTAAERVKAELELQDALREAGATTIAARNLGEASPSVLRAIAEAIRNRPGES